MKLVYGVTPGSVLEVIGSAKLLGNGLDLHFQEDALERIAGGALRSFVVLAARALPSWSAVGPALPADLTQRPLEAKVWANPRGKRVDHRTLVWQGWPIGWPDVPTLVLLRPEVPLAKLPGFEVRQTGFLERLKDEEGRVRPPAGGWIDEQGRVHNAPARVKEAKDDGADVDEGGAGPGPEGEPLPAQGPGEREARGGGADPGGVRVDDGHDQPVGGVRGDGDRPAHVVRREGGEGAAGADAGEDGGGAPSAPRAGRVTWLPPWVLERAGPGPEHCRVRIVDAKTGLNFTKVGDEYEAEVCPEEPAHVWITMDRVTGFRIRPETFERIEPPKRRRRARSLEDL